MELCIGLSLRFGSKSVVGWGAAPQVRSLRKSSCTPTTAHVIWPEDVILTSPQHWLA